MASLMALLLCVLPAAVSCSFREQLARGNLRSTGELVAAESEEYARREYGTTMLMVNGLHADLAKLEQFFGGLSFLQLPPASQKAAPSAHQKGKELDVGAAVKQMASLGPHQMPAMITLLKGMYDTWKDRIGVANKHEQEQKKDFDKTMKDLENKKKKAGKNNDGTYDKIEKYWTRQRELSHRQYHTALKIMHAGMQKFKAVSGAMEDAVGGKKPTANELQAAGLIPEVVLVQMQSQVKELAHWTRKASLLIADAKRVRLEAGYGRSLHHTTAS